MTEPTAAWLRAELVRRLQMLELAYMSGDAEVIEQALIDLSAFIDKYRHRIEFSEVSEVQS